MKLDQLRIKNFKGVENLEIKFNGTETRFMGLNGSGKTTIFEAIWAGFKGISEKDQGGNIIGDRYHFIGKKGSTSKIDIFIKDENRTVTLSTTISKTGNQMEFYDENGLPIDGFWVKNLLDVTMMNATQFCKLSPKDQAIRLGIDLTEYEAKKSKLKTEFTEINALLRSYGTLAPVERVERVSLDKLIADKAVEKARLDKLYTENQAANNILRQEQKEKQEAADLAVDEFNLEQDRRADNIENSKEALRLLTEAGYVGKEVLNFVNSRRQPEERKVYVKIPDPIFVTELPDDIELKKIDIQITEASTINEKAAAYEAYLSKKTEKEKQETKLTANKKSQADLETEKLEYIKKFDFGFAGLEVDEDGGLVLNSRAISTYSKAEREIIVARLAEAQKSPFKVRLIDEFQDLDENNQVKLVNELLGKGYQLLISQVGKPGKPQDNIVYLKECKIISGEESTESQAKLL